MRVSAVVLDMDGLMLDTEPMYKAAWQQASAELGCTLDDPSYMTLVGRPTEDCERELVRFFGPGFPLARFRSRWPELWRVAAEDRGIRTKAGLGAFLSFVEGHKLPVAIATSSDGNYTDFSLRRAGLSGRFPIVVTGDQVAQGKPAPDIYLAAAQRLAIDPSQCIALEDSDAGVLSASAAGMVPVCIPDLKPPSEAAVLAAFRVLPSLDEARWLLARLIAMGQSAG